MLQSKKRTIGVFLLVVLSLISLTMLTGSSSLATYTVAFSLTGIVYFILRALVVRYSNRKIKDFIAVLSKNGYEFLGAVRVTCNPSGGSSDITKDDLFFVHLSDRFILLSKRTDEVNFVRDIPYRLLFDKTLHPHILCRSESNYYLWRKP